MISPFRLALQVPLGLPGLLVLRVLLALQARPAPPVLQVLLAPQALLAPREVLAQLAPRAPPDLPVPLVWGMPG